MAEINITSGGKERIPPATSLLGAAFSTDPVITYMLCSLPASKRLAYLPAYFNSLLTAAALNDATFDEADDWSSCAVLMSPGRRVDNPLTLLPSGFISVLWTIGVRGCQRMLGEFTPLTDAAKAKGLQGQRKYYYVFFVGTRQDCRGKGLSSALIRYYQTIAAREQLPIWLEATTAYSRNLYTKLGFETIEEMVLGKGKAASDGTELRGGEGVKIWGMIWRPTV